MRENTTYVDIIKFSLFLTFREPYGAYIYCRSDGYLGQEASAVLRLACSVYLLAICSLAMSSYMDVRYL